MSREASMKLADKLRTANMNAIAYANAPAGDNFIIGNPNAEAIRVWLPEHLKPEVHTDRRKRQAVLRITEEERTLTGRSIGTATIENYGRNGELKSMNRSHIKKELSALRLKHIEGDRNPLVVTQVKSTKRAIAWTETSLRDAISIVARNRSYAQDSQGAATWYKTTTIHVPVLYTVVANAQTMRFLVGMDEVAHFVAMLPDDPKTVDEAHEALKPKGWHSDWLRQGEWFFAPVANSKILKALDNDDGKKLTASPGRRFSVRVRGRWTTQGTRLENNSSHYATELVVHNGKEYVRGIVKDGRHAHHHDLELKNWHEVHRNREVVMPVTAKTPQRRYWD